MTAWERFSSRVTLALRADWLALVSRHSLLFFPVSPSDSQRPAVGAMVELERFLGVVKAHRITAATSGTVIELWMAFQEVTANGQCP
jgi:hypothetical protein